MFPFFILLTVLFMKLLMILTELAPGGAEKVVLELTPCPRCDGSLPDAGAAGGTSRHT